MKGGKVKTIMFMKKVGGDNQQVVKDFRNEEREDALDEQAEL